MWRVIYDLRHSNMDFQKPTHILMPSNQHEKASSAKESISGSLGIWTVKMSNAENVYFSYHSHVVEDDGICSAILALWYG